MTSPRPLDRPSADFRTDGRWLLLIAAGALAVRLAWIWLHGAVIENEGAAYARLAQSLLAGGDYVANTGGRNTIFPPLYPMAIALLAGPAGSAELAARLVSTISGVLLIWPVYGIARYLGGRSSGLVAAVLAAAAGLLVGLSGSAYSESFYFLLLLSGVYFACRALDDGRLRHAAGAGVLFGCAYLVRPEALAYAALAVAFLAGHALVTRRPWRRAAAQVGVLVACVALLALPYVAWLSVNSGYFRWEGKSLINGIISGRMIDGASYQEAAYGLGPNLEPLGPYLAPDQFGIAATGDTGPGLVSTILADPVPRVAELARLFAAPSGPGGPVLVLLAGIGLVASLLDPRHRVQKLLMIAAGAGYVAILLSLQFYWDRYLFPFTVLALPWAAVGIVTIATLAGRLAARSAVARPRRGLVVAVTAILAIALLTVPSYRYATSDGEFTQSENHALKAAGLWLRERRPATVMGISGVVAFYAGSTLVYLPWAAEGDALRYVHELKPDYVFLRHGDESQRPYIADWLEKGIPDPCAVPVRSFSQDGGGEVTVYQWAC